MQKSKQEYDKFLSTKQEIYLSQAGEKLWNAYNIFIAILAKKPIHNKKVAEQLSGHFAVIFQDSNFVKVFINTFELHKYFYRGHGDTDDEERRFIVAYELLNDMIKTYLVK